jgi:hypothetical protein
MRRSVAAAWIGWTKREPIPSHPLFSGPSPGAVFDFRAHFCHSAPMEAYAFGFRLRTNAPEGQKRFFDQSTMNLKVRLILRSGLTP